MVVGLPVRIAVWIAEHFFFASEPCGCQVWNGEKDPNKKTPDHEGWCLAGKG